MTRTSNKPRYNKDKTLKYVDMTEGWFDVFFKFQKQWLLVGTFKDEEEANRIALEKRDRWIRIFGSK